MENKEFDEHCKKLESYFKGAMHHYQWIVQHLNDDRGSSIDMDIEAQTDYDFAVKHFEKIVEMVKTVGKELQLEK